MKNYKLTNKVIILITLFISSISCNSKVEEAEKPPNTLFDWVAPVDSKILGFSSDFNSSIEIVLSEDQITRQIPLSKIISDYKYLQLVNNDSNLIGEIDKIIFSDYVVFVLDIYINNSLQLFDIQSGEELLVFKPSGEGPGEMKTISDFDVDFQKRKIFIHDESLAKLLEFDFDGVFINEHRLPIRAHSFKVLENGNTIFSCVDNMNDHLGDIGSSDLFILDSMYSVVGSFKFPFLDHGSSNFLPRDLMRSNGEFLSYFPRFSNDVYSIDFSKNVLKSELSLQLGNSGLSKRELKNINEDFVSERKADGKLFGFGHHFITENWIGAKFDRFGGPELQLFYHRKTDQYFSGIKIDFDFEDLINFSFPMACKSSTCISVIDVGQFRNVNMDKYFLSLEEAGKDYSYTKSVFNSIEDFDQPLLLIFKLNE